MNTKHVDSDASEEEVNKAIRLSDEWTDKDGRKLRIISWHPHVEMGSVVTITLTATIELPYE